MFRLEAFGWNDFFSTQLTPLEQQSYSPARVAEENRQLYKLFSTRGETLAELAGKLRHDARSRADLPAVGDWVLVRESAGAERAIIHRVLARRTKFSRKTAGKKTEEQIVAANVGVAFLVCGLDGDFNVRRLERYVAAVYESGAAPVVVLNKADLCTDLARRLIETQEAAPGEPVHVVSAHTGEGLDELAEYLTPGRTVALLGMSGVGKSSLVNAFLRQERQRTSAVRDGDSRGRHTTTHRELIALPSGAILLDTPGMRTLALWANEESVEASFGEIERLARECRFRDCAHAREPGCAVLGGLASGELSEERYESWRKLQREAAAFAARHDVKLRLEHKRKWRAMTKSNRARPDKRR